MDGYGYAYRGGYTTYGGGVTPRTDGWSKPSYTSDHVCQPTIIDAEGRRKPVISYSPNVETEYYVTTEIMEPVPLVTGYKQNTPVRVEVKEYSDGKWNRPSSPEKWRRPSSPVRYRAEEKWVRPSSPEKWRRPSSPVRYRAEEKWVRPSSPVHERPQQVEDFITKVQTEASRPNNNRFGPLSAIQWRKPPNSYHVNNGYGDQNDLGNKEWQRRSYGSWSPPRKDHLSKPTNDINTAMEYLTEAVKPSSGITKPSHHGAWSAPQRGNLSKPTSDVKPPVEYLKEAVKPSSGNSHTPPPYRYSIPVTTTGPKRDSYPETIDSSEAARRYANLNLASSRPMDNYTTTIDSREAARKYGGTTV